MPDLYQVDFSVWFELREIMFIACIADWRACVFEDEMVFHVLLDVSIQDICFGVCHCMLEKVCVGLRCCHRTCRHQEIGYVKGRFYV